MKKVKILKKHRTYLIDRLKEVISDIENNSSDLLQVYLDLSILEGYCTKKWKKELKRKIKNKIIELREKQLSILEIANILKINELEVEKVLNEYE